MRYLYSNKLHILQLYFLFKLVFTVYWQTPKDHNVLGEAGTANVAIFWEAKYGP